MRVLRRIVLGIVWVAVVPLLTYWFVAKSFRVQTLTEKLVLAGLITFGVIMFIAILRTRHVRPAVYVAVRQDRDAEDTSTF